MAGRELRRIAAFVWRGVEEEEGDVGGGRGGRSVWRREGIVWSPI